MKLSEQAQLDNQIAMLEMEIDNSTKRIMQLENSIFSYDVQIIMLKKIIKSLSEVLYWLTTETISNLRYAIVLGGHLTPVELSKDTQ